MEEGELIRPRSRRTDERRTRAGLRRRRVAARERAGRSERPFYGIIRSPSAANDTRALPISFFPPTIRRRRGGRGGRTRSLVTCPLPFPPARRAALRSRYPLDWINVCRGLRRYTTRLGSKTSWPSCPSSVAPSYFGNFGNFVEDRVINDAWRRRPDWPLVSKALSGKWRGRNEEAARSLSPAAAAVAAPPAGIALN